MNKSITRLLILVSLDLALNSVIASNLLPGGAVTPVPGYTYGYPAYPPGSPTGVSSLGGNPRLQEGASWSMPGVTGASANITFENAVDIDPVTGALDFFYQIQNTYTGAATNSDTISPTIVLNESFEGVAITGVEQMNALNFVSFNGFAKPTGGISVASVSLGQYQTDGSADLTVTFSAPIAPKQDSAILVIQTDARDFDQAGGGAFSWMTAPPAGAHKGGSPATNPFYLDALEPLVAPEPGSYGMLSLGVSGLLLLIHRPKKSAIESPSACRTDDHSAALAQPDPTETGGLAPAA